MAIFLDFVYSNLHHEDISLIPNKNGLFGLMKYTYSAQYFLDWKKWKASLLSGTELGALSWVVVMKMFSSVMTVV